MPGNSLNFDVPVPDGMEVYVSDFSVAGTQHRVDNIIAALDGDRCTFALEAEPWNPHDYNAVQVVALKPGFFDTKILLLGYLPRNIAAQVTNSGLLASIRFRPRRIWHGDEGGVFIYADLIGPADEVDKFRKS